MRQEQCYDAQGKVVVRDIAWISLPCWRCIPNSFGDAVARSIALAVAS